MAIDRSQQIARLYNAALARDANERLSFLDKACNGAEDLRQEVESLLAHERTIDAFLGIPALEVTAALQPDVMLGRYRIERQLGRGGMGTVFLARDITLQRQIAIKVLRSSDDADASHQWLLREARSASGLNHPNICTVYEVGEDIGWAYIAMEYVDGRSVRELVDGGPLPVEDAVRYAIEAADALAHAHDRGVVHRDLKAANAMVSSSERLKIVDFGLARRTDSLESSATILTSVSEPGVVMGTPYAMAPEQVRGEAIDARADLWALGVLLYEMLQGAHPFSGATLPELFSSILRDPPAPLSPLTLDPLREIVHKCLEKDPAERFQRAADVRLLLEAVASRLRHRDVPSTPSVATGTHLAPSPLLSPAIGAPGFLGRERELALMEQVWMRATEGQRQLLLIAGEPGIGKTRLSVEFARSRIEKDAIVLVGRCDQEALVPYQPFVEALSWYARACPELDLRAQLAAVGGGAELGPVIPELVRRVPDLPTQPPMNPEGQRYRLFEAVGALMAQAAVAQPVLLMIDDLHWADQATLLMLRHLARAPGAASLCVLVTYRETEVGRTNALAELLADLRREQSVTRLSLSGLEKPQAKGLIDAFVGGEASPQLTRLVLDSTEGNPFFIGEMLRHLTETGAFAKTDGVSGSSWSARTHGLPEGIKEVIGQRLSRLNETCRQTLSLAAVIGREFELDVLEVLGNLPEDSLLDAIDEGVRAQLIDEAPEQAGRFSFVHGLIRETLYGALTATRRVRLHRRVGEAIERLAQRRPDPPLADLAYHFVQAASPDTADKAIDYATRAGDRAADTLAHEEAARFYEMALQSIALKVAGSETEARRGWLHARRAQAFGALGQWALEKAEIEQALQHIDPLQIERRCELLQEMAGASFHLFDVPLTKRLAVQAVELAEQVRRRDVAGKALAWLGACQQADGDLDGAIVWYRTAVEKAGNTDVHPIGLLSHYLAGRSTEAIVLGTQAAEIARSSRDTSFTMFALPQFGLILGSVGRYAEAAKLFDEVRQFGRKYGVRPLLARATSMAAGFHLSMFDFEEAAALGFEARELALSAGFAPSVVSASIDILLSFARRRDAGSAEALLQETAAAAATTPGWHQWLWQLRLCQARAELALARGAFDTAVVEASEGINRSQARRRPKYETLGFVTRAHALHGLGRIREAIADARSAVLVARSTADPALLLQALDAQLSLDGDDESSVEALALDVRISSELPNERIRQRFTESEIVQRVRRANSA